MIFLKPGMVVVNYINARQSTLSYNLDYQLCHSLAK